MLNENRQDKEEVPADTESAAQEAIDKGSQPEDTNTQPDASPRMTTQTNPKMTVTR